MSHYSKYTRNAVVKAARRLLAEERPASPPEGSSPRAYDEHHRAVDRFVFEWKGAAGYVLGELLEIVEAIDDPKAVRDLVGALSGQTAEEEENATDFDADYDRDDTKVGRSWAAMLIEAVFGPLGHDREETDQDPAMAAMEAGTAATRAKIESMRHLWPSQQPDHQAEVDRILRGDVGPYVPRQYRPQADDPGDAAVRRYKSGQAVFCWCSVALSWTTGGGWRHHATFGSQIPCDNPHPADIDDQGEPDG